MPTDTQHNDTLLVEKQSGEVLGPVQGTVEGSSVVVEAIEEIVKGDVLIHRLSDESDIRLVVHDPGYQPQVGSVPAHYKAQVEPES
ncbi:hypothetical protein P1P91_02410 [Halomonas piscis]|uniref:DUF2171 domain-containing protein n=1 Tax=Halomonas piscis TaxID=3031727 RepID=A0ABY9Z1T1_9GAMM|nr:hypothetical protein [Halomonas piscis]WNK20560.1 hypothetical protein P1P91_02410 [Halomonas piscis]